MSGYKAMEALLSGRTVYGDRRDVEPLRREALEALSAAETKFTEVQRLRQVIQTCVSRGGDFEVRTLRHIRIC